MTYEEARDEIKHLSNFLVTESEPFQNSPDWSQITICFDFGAFDTLGLAIEALEKQIPEKVKRINNNMIRNACPDCNSVNEEGNFYCRYCGKKLDWTNFWKGEENEI